MKKIKILLLSSVVFFSCGEEKIEVEKTTEFKKYTLTAEDSIPVEPTRLKGIAHMGDYAYRTDSSNQYAAGVVEMLHDTLINSCVRVCLDFWVKSSNPIKGDGMAISFNSKDATVFWKTYDPIEYGAKTNEWINIKDSITFNSNQINQSGMFIKLFGYNANKKSIMDFDDINITFKKVYTVLE